MQNITFNKTKKLDLNHNMRSNKFVNPNLYSKYTFPNH